MWPLRNRQLDRIEARQIRTEAAVVHLADAVEALLNSNQDNLELAAAAAELRRKTDALKAALASAQTTPS